MVRVDSGPGCLHLKACEARNSSIVAPACGASKRGMVALMVPLWDFSPNARRKGLSLTSVVRSLGFPFFPRTQFGSSRANAFRSCKTSGQRSERSRKHRLPSLVVASVRCRQGSRGVADLALYRVVGVQSPMARCVRFSVFDIAIHSGKRTGLSSCTPNFFDGFCLPARSAGVTFSSRAAMLRWNDAQRLRTG